ncbi:hypothetical protein L210DRAFT_2534067 [Boletus edulis BED1]|uniref:Uncharacterized protein n=1 Tax=Boletus edulis BED1 TaxID=1328754 RepID=A0AAD4G5M5_BOLED|nr:hypothetical protein L210DRAFT_2534067 [Boletus edulis BED1]
MGHYTFILSCRPPFTVSHACKRSFIVRPPSLDFFCRNMIPRPWTCKPSSTIVEQPVYKYKHDTQLRQLGQLKSAQGRRSIDRRQSQKVKGKGTTKKSAQGKWQKLKRKVRARTESIGAG